MHQEKSLLIAILVQAIKDYSNPKYHDDVLAFLNSNRFMWMIDAISDDTTILPIPEKVKEGILSHKFSVSRMAYHSRRNNNGQMAL